jgi:uncharacterized protein
MSGFSPSLPLRRDPTYVGFALNDTMLDVIKQNFKHLVLTAPGERMMIPDFGVGIRNYLFETNDPLTHSAIRSGLSSQIKKYMPFISILNVEFNDNGSVLGDLSNSLQIIITYQILPLGLSDILLVEI